MLNETNLLGFVKHLAFILRDHILTSDHRDWSFNGSFADYKNPPLLQFFLTNMLLGRHVRKVEGVCSKEVDELVNVACQFLVQNTKSDRQVIYKPRTDKGYRHTSETPLSVGLPLTRHSRLRDKTLVQCLPLFTLVMLTGK